MKTMSIILSLTLLSSAYSQVQEVKQVSPPPEQRIVINPKTNPVQAQVIKPEFKPNTDVSTLVETTDSKALRGTESGGGGGIAWVEGRPVLIDFFTVISDLSHLNPLAQTADHISQEKSFSLNSKTTPVIVEEHPSFALALKVLDAWQSLPIDTISFQVMQAFRAPLLWSFVDDELTAPPFYLPANLPQQVPIQVAAYYTRLSPNQFHISIHRPTWNVLDLRDQAGLLIHETLRQVQIGYGNAYNDEALQRATAIYSLCAPSARLNYYLFYLLNNSPARADKIYGTFEKFIQQECKRST